MRWLTAGAVLLFLVATATPAAQGHEPCPGTPSGPVRVHLQRVVGHSEGSGSFTINPKFSCARVDFRFEGLFPADRPQLDVPDSTATVHQVAVVDGVTVETWFNVTIPNVSPVGTFGVGLEPWYPGFPIDFAWNVTGLGAIEFSYRGFS